MRNFRCDRCGAAATFGAARCVSCEAPLGYLPDRHVLAALDAGPEPATLRDEVSGTVWQRCLNTAWGCNWMVGVDEPTPWCRSCRLTRGRPDIARPDAIEAWVRVEADKRRLVHQLDALGLPVEERTGDDSHRLVFDLVHLPGEPGLTGHRDGVITLDLLEADEGHRDALRHQLDESFRTVLGHLRHEVGHYYWTRLVGQSDYLGGFRQIFGDERVDYRDALDTHYATARVGQSDDRYISDYAQAHPLEDWAESFAHYLHILDATGTAAAQGLTVDNHRRPESMTTIAEIVDSWRPIAEAVNAVSASLGSPPMYPFVLSDAVVEKLGFVHDRVVEHTERVRFYSFIV